MLESTSYEKQISNDKSEEDWKKELTPEEYHVLRGKGTERPFTGKYNLHFENGDYHCRACNAKLFESGNKFESGCGWPSFDQAVEGAIEYIRDTSHGMIRHRDCLCQLWESFRACVQRWARRDNRSALLHQFHQYWI